MAGEGVQEDPIMRVSPGGALQTGIAPRSGAKLLPLLTRIAATWPGMAKRPPAKEHRSRRTAMGTAGYGPFSPEDLATKLQDVTSHYARTPVSGRALGIVIRMEVLFMPKKLLVLGSLAAVLLTASAAPAITPGVDTGVMVDALVLDRAGNPVPGLNRGDFEVIIGEQVRPVSGARMLAADTTSRRFVFIFNRRGALPAQLRRMKEGLEEFVSARFGEGDEALFVDFAEVPRITRGWRRGSAEALPEVRNVTAMGFRSPLGPAADAADAVFMLEALAGRLGELSGRKVVVLFSGSLSAFVGQAGGDLVAVRSPRTWPSNAPPESRRGTDDAAGALAQAFNAANGSLYTVHLEGARRQDEGILEASRSEFVGTAYDANGSVVGLRRARDSSASLSGRRKQAFDRPTDDFLSSLASETGGAYTAQATDFARILEGIEASNRLWYELSFEPFGTNIPGRYQPHEIRVRNRPGLRVVVRPGHVVP